MLPEIIICSAVMYQGRSVAGRRHRDCYETIETLLGFEIDIKDDRSGEGFLTNYNRFVTRKEAYQIARAQGQLLLAHSEGCEESLSSEHLFPYIDADR